MHWLTHPQNLIEVKNQEQRFNFENFRKSQNFQKIVKSERYKRNKGWVVARVWWQHPFIVGTISLNKTIPLGQDKCRTFARASWEISSSHKAAIQNLRDPVAFECHIKGHHIALEVDFLCSGVFMTLHVGLIISELKAGWMPHTLPEEYETKRLEFCCRVLAPWNPYLDNFYHCPKGRRPLRVHHYNADKDHPSSRWLPTGSVGPVKFEPQKAVRSVDSGGVPEGTVRWGWSFTWVIGGVFYTWLQSIIQIGLAVLDLRKGQVEKTDMGASRYRFLPLSVRLSPR